MPVILCRSDEDAWLDPEVHEQELLQKLLKPCSSTRVRNVNRSEGVGKSSVVQARAATRRRMPFTASLALRLTDFRKAEGELCDKEDCIPPTISVC
jgi:hypothetical protein